MIAGSVPLVPWNSIISWTALPSFSFVKHSFSSSYFLYTSIFCILLSSLMGAILNAFYIYLNYFVFWATLNVSIYDYCLHHASGYFIVLLSIWYNFMFFIKLVILAFSKPLNVKVIPPSHYTLTSTYYPAVFNNSNCSFRIGLSKTWVSLILSSSTNCRIASHALVTLFSSFF